MQTTAYSICLRLSLRWLGQQFKKQDDKCWLVKMTRGDDCAVEMHRWLMLALVEYMYSSLCEPIKQVEWL